MVKKVILGIFVLLFVTILYYLFFKPADYIVTFSLNALPGTINQTVKLWAKDAGNSKFLGQENLSEFAHELQFGDSIHTYQWKINPVNDSMSKVRVLVTDKKQSLKNRITVPFGETAFEKRTKKTIYEVVKVLREHKKRIKIKVNGLGEFPEKYVAYVPMKGLQSQKAHFMMKEYSFLNTVLLKNKIQLDGQPIIEIEKWNLKNDSIQFNFCYPIKKTDSLPKIKGLKYKKLDMLKVIKATYNGNYITSDRAWYSLLQYAKNNNLEVSQHLLEIFYSNPNMGGDELDWKAEIFLPIK